MKITIEKIEKPYTNQEYGLVDAWICTEDFECPMTLAYSDLDIEEDTEIKNGSIYLHSLQNGEFSVYENEEAYYAESNSNMAAESIIPIGNFGDKKTANCIINGIVCDVNKHGNLVNFTIKCNGILFKVIKEEDNNKIIKVGDIVHSVWNAELKIER